MLSVCFNMVWIISVFVQKYERRRNFVKDEKECRAFASLSKQHMSTDDDDSASESEGGWVSRPPKYRSVTLIAFLNK